MIEMPGSSVMMWATALCSVVSYVFEDLWVGFVDRSYIAHANGHR